MSAVCIGEGSGPKKPPTQTNLESARKKKEEKTGEEKTRCFQTCPEMGEESPNHSAKS